MSTQDNNADAPRQLARLWMEAQPSVLSFICASIPRFHDAEDVLQEVAVDVADHFDRYDPSRPFVAWAIGIARFKVAAHFRQQNRESPLLSGEMIDLVAEAHERQHEQLDDMREPLETCLEELSAKARRVVKMRYSEDLRSGDIAEKIGSTSGSVRVMLVRSRTQLLDCIKEKLSSGGPK